MMPAIETIGYSCQLPFAPDKGTREHREVCRIAVETLEWRERVRQFSNDELRDLFWFKQISQAVATEGAQSDANRQVVTDELLSSLGDEDLTTPASGEHSRQSVETGREVVASCI